MLGLILQIFVIIVVTGHVADVADDKNIPSLPFKIVTPLAWIIGGPIGGLFGMILSGKPLEAFSAPDATVNPEMSNALFLAFVGHWGGVALSVGAVYVIARLLPPGKPREDEI